MQQAHTVCGAGEWESAAPAPDGGGDRNCTELTVCRPGEAESRPPGLGADRVCAACDPADDEFASSAGQGACAVFSTCGADERVVARGTATADLVCGQ